MNAQSSPQPSHQWHDPTYRALFSTADSSSPMPMLHRVARSKKGPPIHMRAHGDKSFRVPVDVMDFDLNGLPHSYPTGPQGATCLTAPSEDGFELQCDIAAVSAFGDRHVSRITGPLVAWRN